jgi:7-cyano-7-deazaguanine synthase
MKTVALLSGGLDSVTLAHRLAAAGQRPLILVSVNYGQRHLRELNAARQCAIRLDADRHIVLPLDWLSGNLKGSSLTSDYIPVPDGHYAEETMRQTVVPNRNMILLSLAAGIAIAEHASRLALAVHAGDHYIYPDCRPEFIGLMSDAIRSGNASFAADDFAIDAPFLYWTKTEIAAEAGRLGVPIDSTWSCYKGGEVHCGRCGTCVERKEALRDAGVPDPTAYLDREFMPPKPEVTA